MLPGNTSLSSSFKESMMLTFISLCITFGALEISVLCSRANECHRLIVNEDGKKARQVFYCCNNHEDKNGQCVECSIGYTSTQGTKCEPCPKNKFGIRCAHMCSCESNQRCDTVKGCVDFQKTVSMEGTYQTEIYTNSKTSSPEMMTFRDDNIFKDIKGIPGSTILVICLVGIAGPPVIFLISCVMYSYKKKRPFGSGHNSNSRGALPPLPIRISPVYDEGNNSYDEIDEINIIQRMPAQLSITHTREDNASDTSDDEIVSNRNSYTNPYQPIVESIIPHKYNELQDCDTARKSIISVNSSHSDITNNLIPHPSSHGIDIKEMRHDLPNSGQTLPCKMVVEYLDVVHIDDDLTTT